MKYIFCSMLAFDTETSSDFYFQWKEYYIFSICVWRTLPELINYEN